MENVTFDELSVMAFVQRSSKPELQGRTSRHISSGLDLTYALSTMKSQKPIERDLELLFEEMYDDYMGGQLSDATRISFAALATLNLHTPNASTTIAETTQTPTNSSTEAPAIPNTSHDVDELHQQKHLQQQNAQPQLQSEAVADNAHDAMFDENMFINPFASPSTSSSDSSSQYVDPSNMCMFNQPYQHNFHWTKDHPLEQVIGESSRPVLIRNQQRTNAKMCIYALFVSTMKPNNVKDAMTDVGWIEAMQEELL
ncbi:hypothetical protein Tco_0357189 [Tanacetum coccineum]